MKIIKKVQNYAKNNKMYIFIMFIGILMFALQMKYVVLYADDFALGTTSKGGIGAAFEHLKFHYMNWGGGLTAFIAVIFMMFKPVVWKIFNCLLIFLTVSLSVKMITYNKRNNKALVAGIIWLCIYVMSIWISREALYWLDGALAYLLSFFQLFIYFYYMYSRLILKINKKYDKVLLPIVSLFAGWSSAQTGPMAIITAILIILWVKLIKKEKVSKIYYISCIITIIGFAIFYFAPGNNMRMAECGEFATYSFSEKLLYRVQEVYGLIFNFTANVFTGIPFYILMSLGMIAIISLVKIHKNTEEKQWVKSTIIVSSVIQLVYIALCLCIKLNIPYSTILGKWLISFENLLDYYKSGTFSIGLLIPYIVSTIVMLSSIVTSIYIAKNKKDPLLLLLLLSAYLTQGVMVMAPYSPLRTTFYAIIFLSITIAYLIKYAQEENIFIGSVIVLVVSIYSIEFGIASVILYAVIKNIVSNLNIDDIFKIEIGLIIFIMLIIAVGNYKETFENYKVNEEIYEINMQRINQYKENCQQGIKEEELYLLSPKNDIYGFTPLVGGGWVEDVVKDYFELGNVKLIPEVSN